MNILINHDGLLVDEQGVIRGIEIPISNELVTGFRRVARHEDLRIRADLQMVQQVRVVKLDEQGTELCQKVLETVVNPNVRAQLLNAYQDTFYPANTSGAYVDGKTGVPVETADVEGAVEQLAFFQGMTIGVVKSTGVTVTDATSIPSLVYTLLKSEILKLDAQGRL